MDLGTIVDISSRPSSVVLIDVNFTSSLVRIDNDGTILLLINSVMTISNFFKSAFDNWHFSKQASTLS